MVKLQINYEATETLVGIQVKDNDRIVTTRVIPKDSIIYAGRPYLIHYRRAYETLDGLLYSLHALDSGTRDKLQARMQNFLYPRTLDQIRHDFKHFYGIKNPVRLDRLMQDSNRQIIVWIVRSHFQGDGKERYYLYHYASKFNHACVPNCSWDIKDQLLTIRSLGRIPSGAECTISYWPNTIPQLRLPEQRAEFIMERGAFTCHCALCYPVRSHKTIPCCFL